MRRIGLGLTMAGLLAVTMGGLATGADAASGVTYTSDDGLVRLIVPDDGASDDAPITISRRTPQDAPPELADFPGTPTQYLIEPVDIVFDPPAS